MKTHEAPASQTSAERHESPTKRISQLVGEMYVAAPVAERCRILEHLIKPLGALSLVAVANGIFTKIWFHSGWRNLEIQPDDALTVRADDVMQLADYVQQASIETIYGLAQLIASSPALIGMSAAALLAGVLVRHARNLAGPQD